MANSYKKYLDVSAPTGKRVIVTVTRNLESVTIKTPFIEEVKKDGVGTAGIITVHTTRMKYLEALKKLEKYLETLFLKELGNDNLHTSDGAGDKSERDPKLYIGVDKGKIGGDRSTESLHLSPRGNDASKSSGEGDSGNKVEPKDNRKSKKSSEDGD